jgi:hypothetical protein
MLFYWLVCFLGSTSLLSCTPVHDSQRATYVYMYYVQFLFIFVWLTPSNIFETGRQTVTMHRAETGQCSFVLFLTRPAGSISNTADS